MLIYRQDIITIAPHTVMLKDSAITNGIIIGNSLLTGMENAASTVRETAATIKNNTMEATKKLSANLSDKMNKIKTAKEADLTLNEQYDWAETTEQPQLPSDLETDS
ncbi:MAG: hypothetical protein RR332_04360, partial [Clostridiales bacterium]